MASKVHGSDSKINPMRAKKAIHVKTLQGVPVASRWTAKGSDEPVIVIAKAVPENGNATQVLSPPVCCEHVVVHPLLTVGHIEERGPLRCALAFLIHTDDVAAKPLDGLMINLGERRVINQDSIWPLRK
jgi:hypothetical protein